MKKILFAFLLIFVLYSCSSLDSQDKSNVVDVGETSTGEIISLVSYTWWFQLIQKSDTVILEYNNINLKEWSLEVPQELPFVYDEWCELLTNKLIEAQNQTAWSSQPDNWKQWVWEKLSIADKRSCIKENIVRTAFVENINSDYYYIWKRGYEWKVWQVFNMSTSKKYDKLYIAWEFQKVVWVWNDICVYFVWWMGNLQYLDKLNLDWITEQILEADDEKISFENGKKIFQWNEPKVKDFNITDNKINIEYILSADWESQLYSY
jgi:hypothetical protein